MQRRGGVTILELVGALLALSIVAALAIPAYFERSEVTLENACVLLARDLRAAQNRSAYLGASSRFVFTEDGDGYEVLDEDGRVLENPRTNQTFRRRFSRDGVFRGVEVVDVDLGPDRALSFDQRGDAVEGGEVTLAFRGETRTLRVERSTGTVTLLGSTSGWTDDGD